MKTPIFTLSLLSLLLVACGGGGGGGSSSSMPDMETGGMEKPSEADSNNEDEGLRAGHSSQPVTITLADETGDITSQEVLSYLRFDIGGGPYKAGPGFSYSDDPGLARFVIAPTVRIAQGTPDHERALIHHAVAVINRELPHQWHLQIGSDAPPLAVIESIPNNQIFVDFAPYDDWNDPLKGSSRPDSEAIAQIDVTKEYDSSQLRWEKKRMNKAHVWMSSETDLTDPVLLSILIHELLHTLGIYGHADADEFPDSLMRDSELLVTERVPEVDGTVLRAIYTRYHPGTEPEQISVNSLGPWESTETNLTGEIGSVSFGVSHRHGVSVPWTNGPTPNVALAENPSIVGTVTWNGGLVGFTPSEQPVSGGAQISVNLSTLTGRADFTDLESWPAGQAPGRLGTGSMWGDGDLGYTLSVSGNYLRSTGGDSGTVAGNFYGNDHADVAGSLERDDLTAAFGASR